MPDLQLTYTEENYLKAIYSIQEQNEPMEVSVNEIAAHVNTRPATVTDMLRKLSEKELVHYEKYKKVTLTEAGKQSALTVLRKHRLWETFLHEKLSFQWDEVHEVAEQLEHIQSTKLIDRLDEYLGYPEFDPHGDPIPKSNGELPETFSFLLSEAEAGKRYKVVGVKDTSTAFLQQLEKQNIKIGSHITVAERLPYDNSLLINVGQQDIHISEKIAQHLLVTYFFL